MFEQVFEQRSGTRNRGRVRSTPSVAEAASTPAPATEDPVGIDGRERCVNHRYRAERADVVADVDEEPAVFLWRGRRYEVRVVVTHWVEAVPWWVGRGCGQRHVWRVEAATRTGIAGVYDLYRISSDQEQRWGLERVID